MRVRMTLGCNSVGNAEASDSNRRRTSKSPRVLPEETRVSSDAILDLNLVPGFAGRDSRE